MPTNGPVNPVTAEELRATVEKYWVIDEIRPARIHANVPEEMVNFGDFTGEAKIEDVAPGRKAIPAWLLSAHLPD